jgi:DNA-binding transcriptional ArsR family regulator
MDRKTFIRFEARAKILKALAHPTRLFIVDELSRGQRCVQELTEMIGSDISTVSKHLSVLKNVNVVSDEKRGTQVFYTLKMSCAVNFFNCVENILYTNIAEQMELAGDKE